MKEKPRGIRNNNPLNIRIGNTWLGEVAHPTDPDFEQFVTIYYGLRAAFVILRRYIRRYKRDTISSIISAWAPATENCTLRYIDHVSAAMQISPDAQLHYEDKATMVALVLAMAHEECGVLLDAAVIEKAYDMA